MGRLAPANVGLHLVWEMLGRCSHAMEGGLECVFLTVLTRGRFIRPGHESCARSAQFSLQQNHW
jgi:hypothetical protein